jgi:hypothetical protein
MTYAQQFYGQKVMSEGAVRQRYRMVKDGQTNAHNEERSGWPFVVNNDIVQSVDQKIWERQHFRISELLCKFPQISCTDLYETVTVNLGHHNFWKRQVLKMLTGAHKM